MIAGKVTLIAIFLEYIVFTFFLKNKKEMLLRSVLTNYLGIFIRGAFTAWIVNTFLFQVWNNAFLGKYALINFYDFNLGVIEFICLFLVAILLHELFGYIWHYLDHRFDFLWSFHQYHHASRFLNYSVGVRVPTLLFFQGYISTMLLAVLGIPLEIFLIVINFNLIYGLWTHSDYWPEMPTLTKVFITPLDHAKHHERIGSQQNSNLGSMLSIYDHLFKTYSKQKCSYIYGVDCTYNAETFFEAQLVPPYQYMKNKLSPLLNGLQNKA